MDNIRVCRWCRRMYSGFGNHCPECVEKLDEAFVTVRAYLDNHRGANAHKVADETGVDIKIILQLLKDERLSEYTGERFWCEVCHKEIKSGRFCDKCKRMMQAALQSKSKPAEPREIETPRSAREHGRKVGAGHGGPTRAVRMYDSNRDS